MLCHAYTRRIARRAARARRIIHEQGQFLEKIGRATQFTVRVTLLQRRGAPGRYAALSGKALSFWSLELCSNNRGGRARLWQQLSGT